MAIPGLDDLLPMRVHVCTCLYMPITALDALHEHIELPQGTPLRAGQWSGL